MSDDTVRPEPTRDQIDGWLDGMQLAHLPSFVTTEQFLAAIADARGRDIRLMPAPGLPTGLCGVWMATSDYDMIVIDDQLTGPRRDLVILHEAAHVLCDHHGTADIVAGRDPQPLLRSLTGDHDVSTMLFRSHFDSYQEWQAEWIATYFMSRTRGTRRSSWVTKAGTRYGAKMLFGAD